MLRSPASRLKAFLVLGFAIATGLPAQSKPAKEEPETAASFGAVTGHVYLAGSNLPARFAQVGLQPIQVTKPAQPIPGRGTPLDFKVYETDLEGGFTLPHVSPGTYYIVVKEPGCVSPFSQFSESDLEHPSDAIAQQIAQTIPTVSVRPSSTASIVIQLQRGATLSGTVRFDDGTAYPDASVEVERKGTDGKWDLPRATNGSTNSDQDGRWVIGGLPAGEYRAQTSLRLDERRQNSLLGLGGSLRVNLGYSLPVYLGDTTRRRDAKVVTLMDAQDLEGQDITIPVSKLHAVRGALLDAGTGQAMNGGNVALKYTDTGEEVASVKVDPETRSFTFDFIPEGTYSLESKNGHEMRLEQRPGIDEMQDPFGMFKKEIPLRWYNEGQTPLLVQGETSGANLALKPKSAQTP